MAKKVAKKKQGIVFEGIGFNKGIINSYKTEAEFLAAMDSKENAHVFEGDEARADKLKQLYALVQPKTETTEGPIKTEDFIKVAESKKAKNS
jgi:hypothetical protein